MAPATKQNATRVLAGLPPWLTATVTHSESFRFEALTLLEAANARLAEIEATPPADGAAAAIAVGAPLHGIVKALLAARGVKSYSARASLELLGKLYAGELPPTQIEALVALQGLKLQGPAAVAAARVFTDAATRLLTRGS
jgi:hypothetical protein